MRARDVPRAAERRAYLAGEDAESLRRDVRAWLKLNADPKSLAIGGRISVARLLAFLEGEAALRRIVAYDLRSTMRRAPYGFSGGVARPGAGLCPDSALERRKREAEERRQAHEQRWLAEEQVKYRLPRRGRALSEMPA